MTNKVILNHRVKNCYIENVSGEREVHKKKQWKKKRKRKNHLLQITNCWTAKNVWFYPIIIIIFIVLFSYDIKLYVQPYCVYLSIAITIRNST